MKIIHRILALFFVVGFAGPAVADVSIVYPIDGQSYPIADPAPGALDSAYFTVSLGVSCRGGSHDVKWGFDGNSVGSTTFYDQISAQQVWKLPGGKHTFWVDADECGKKAVTFMIGG